MSQRLKAWQTPILVTAMDVIWGWSLTTFARPWLFQMLGLGELEAISYYDNVMEPRLWLEYAIVLIAQLSWVNLIAPRPLSTHQLRLCWWLGCGMVIASALVLRQGLVLPSGPSLLLLGVQIGDLLLLYWLATRLMTPQPQRRVIPGWW